MKFYRLDKESGVITEVPTIEEFQEITKAKNYNEDRIIAEDEFGHYLVTTYFTGTDQRFMADFTEPPILFVTSVMDNGKDRGLLYEERRYSTMKDAIEGHKVMAEKWKARYG